MSRQPADTFSGKQSSPFGQSLFAEPITTTSFGTVAAPEFGISKNSSFSTKPSGSTTGGLFDTTLATPTFRQPATSQPSFGGSSTPNTNTGLFGNQQNANTGLFGATNTTPAFGQTAKPGGFGFGATTGTGLFGQMQQTTQQTTPSLFGPSNTATNTNLFGATSVFRQCFAGNNAASRMTGTVVEFSCITGYDTMIKDGVTQTISTRLYCISCMEEYDGKSYEELRFEDYAAGRKRQTQGAQTTAMFGSLAQPSMFGNTGVNTSTANTGFEGTSTGFGAPTLAATTSGLFGKPMDGFGATATTSSAFLFNEKSYEELRFGDYAAGRKGQTQGAQTTGMFGSPAQPSLFGNTGVNTSTANTGFGATSTGFGAPTQAATTSGLFGKPMAGFGATATTSSAFRFNSTTTTANPFGTNTQTKPFGAAAPTPLFGTTNTTQPAVAGFGTNNTTAFGNFCTVQPNQSIGLFNQNKAPFNMPASTVSTGFTGFGQNTATNTIGGLFGAKPAGTTAFGTTPSFAATPAPAFGANTGFGVTPATGSLFNLSFKPTGQPRFTFGTTPITSTGLDIGMEKNLSTGSSISDPPKPRRHFITRRTDSSFNGGYFRLGDSLATNNNTAPGLSGTGGGIGMNSVQQNSVANQVHQQILALRSVPSGDTSLSKSLLPASSKTKSPHPVKPNAACVTLRRTGYYIISSFDKLDEYARVRSCIVPDFIVDRKGCGNVYYPESFDFNGWNLDEIVHFRNKAVIMVDQSTSKTLSSIPLLSTKAGPRDKELWANRLKEECQALIKYVQNNKGSGNDWFRLESNKEGTRWFGKCWYMHNLLKYEFDVEFDISVTYPTTVPEIALPELNGKTAKMYRGGKICLTDHFKPLWARNVPTFGIAHAMALGLRPWLAVEVPDLIEKGVITHKDKKNQ